MSTDGVDLANWLEKVQRDMGIIYTPDSAEEKIREAFEELRAMGVRGDVSSVTYWGYREEPGEHGERLRTTLRELHADITTGDGTRYHLTLIGPYSKAEESE